MKKSLLLPCLIAAMSGSALAATSYNFDAQAVNDFFTGDVAGWTQDVVNPTGITTTFPMAYIAPANFTGTATNGAYLGTLRGNLAPNATTTISGSLTDAGAVSGKQLSLNFAITDAVDSFTSRDTFGFKVTDSSAAVVTTISLVPTSGDDSTWTISYSLGADGPVTTASTVAVNAGYILFAYFTDTGIRLTYGTAVDGVGTNEIANITTSAAAGKNFGSLQVYHTPDGLPGTSADAIIFDNISVVASVPEPSAALLLGVASLGLLRRRRA